MNNTQPLPRLSSPSRLPPPSSGDGRDLTITSQTRSEVASTPSLRVSYWPVADPLGIRRSGPVPTGRTTPSKSNGADDADGVNANRRSLPEREKQTLLVGEPGCERDRN